MTEPITTIRKFKLEPEDDQTLGTMAGCQTLTIKEQYADPEKPVKMTKSLPPDIAKSIAEEYGYDKVIVYVDKRTDDCTCNDEFSTFGSNEEHTETAELLREMFAHAVLKYG